jgi:hypothetical protein
MTGYLHIAAKEMDTSVIPAIYSENNTSNLISVCQLFLGTRNQRRYDRQWDRPHLMMFTILLTKHIPFFVVHLENVTSACTMKAVYQISQI